MQKSDSSAQIRKADSLQDSNDILIKENYYVSNCTTYTRENWEKFGLRVSNFFENSALVIDGRIFPL